MHRRLSFAFVVISFVVTGFVVIGFVVIGATLAATLAAATAGADNWVTYHNDCHGTTIDYPALFKAQPPPINNDGRAFKSADGAAYSVSASYNALDFDGEIVPPRHWLSDALGALKRKHNRPG